MNDGLDHHQVCSRVSHSYLTCYLEDYVPQKAFLEGLAGQGSRIEAVFEIEAQVVDDQINLLNPQPGHEHDRLSQSIDIPSKPLTPTPSDSSSPTKKAASPSPVKAPISSSPLPLIRFPGSNDAPRSPASERGQGGGGGGGGDGGAPMFWTETTSSGAFADTEASVSSQPERPQVHWNGLLSPERLPPRHVRTRRDSMAYIRKRALSGGVATDTSTGLALNTNASRQSPLGQLYGTIVEDEDEGDGLSATELPPTRRSRLISNFSEGLAMHRRRLSNTPTQRPILEQPELELPEPETTQEIQDEEEEEDSPMAENRALRRTLTDLENRQKRMEGQLERLITTLSQHTQGLDR